MVMNQPFTTTQQQVVSFDHVDIPDATGYSYYYLLQSSTNLTTVAQVLTPNVNFHSTKTYEDKLISGAAQTFEITPFKIPQDIIGVATLDCSITSTNPLPDATFTLQRDRGGTVTTVGTAAVITLSVAAEGFYNIQIPIATRTHFQVGDILQIKMETSSATVTTIGCDPTNTAGSVVTNTKSTLAIPYELPNQ